MKITDLDEGVGRIVKGVNTTADVGPDEIKKQAAKFGNKVDRDGRPPELSKKVKGSSTNVLYNLGMAESKQPKYTAREWAIIEGGHTLDKPTPSVSELAKKHNVSVGHILKQLEKGIEVEYEHTSDFDVSKEIALDHIAELPDYYTRLKKMEKEHVKEFKKGGDLWNSLIEDRIEIVDVEAIHLEMISEMLNETPSLIKENTDYQTFEKFIKPYLKTKPIEGQKYIYCMIFVIPHGNIISISGFDKPYEFVKKENDYYIFNINGKLKKFPESNSSGDLLKYLVFFKNNKERANMLLTLDLKYSNWNIKKKILEKTQKKISEGVMVKFERGPEFDILHFKDTNEKGRVEVRGKKGYERGGYDPKDPLHQTLDKLGKAANISDLMNGEVIAINPHHPDGKRALATAKQVMSEDDTKLYEFPEELIDINGIKDYSLYIDLIEAEISKTSLYENLDNSNIKILEKLKQLSVQNPKIGNTFDYVFVMLSNDKLHILESQKNVKLLDIKNNQYTFDDGKKYPDSRWSKLSYSHLYLFDNDNKFEKFKTLLRLKFNTVLERQVARENDTKEITPQILKKLEFYIDKMFASLGMDVEFTRHFQDRVNDPRNVNPITIQELARLFKETYRKYGKKIAQMGPQAQAVIKDMQTDINLPFVLTWDAKNKELDLVAKTIMRKKNFSTPNQELPLENIRKRKCQK